MEQYITFATNNPMLSGAWVVIFLMIIFISIKMKMSPVKQISTQELTFLINKEDGVIVDIRADKDFKAGHILDSKHLSPEKIKDNDFVSLEKHKDKPIIVVCTAGITASKVAEQLSKAGFAQVSLLKGGLNSWVSANLPMSKK